MKEHILLPVVAGPTASGKTACAVALCGLLNGEVVSADSMQVYRGMEILSAVPDEGERRGIAHHMIGIERPHQPMSAAAYRDRATLAIEKIAARGKQPVLCGGTGLYIDAITRPMRFSEKSDPALREELHKIAEQPGGRGKLHAILSKFDPESARRLHPNDLRRVIRAIEIFRLTGVTLTMQNQLDAARQGDYDELIFAIDWPREELYARIDRRVDEMIVRGLLPEVRALMRLSEEHPTAAQAIGYKEIAAALDGAVPLPEAILQMKQATRNYAKRQLTWFRRDTRTIWLTASGKTPEDLAREMKNIIMSRRGYGSSH
jgi:tRNA dimethylallyltransferase